jgi:hypothetical protein
MKHTPQPPLVPLLAPVYGPHPTIRQWAKNAAIPYRRALLLWKEHKAPERVGIGRRGLHGEPESLYLWAKRQGMDKATAAAMYRAGRLKGLGVVSGVREWFETEHGVTGFMTAQREQGEAILRMMAVFEKHQQRLSRWKTRLDEELANIESQQRALRRLAINYRVLQSRISRYESSRRRGDTYISIHEINELKERLFPPDPFTLRMQQRRAKWRAQRRKNHEVPVVSAVQQTNETAPPPAQ